MRAKWQGLINQLLYGVIFTRELTDEVVARAADAAVDYTVLGAGPDAYYWAATEALASDQDLEGLSKLPQYDRAEIDRFLRALVVRLDELRPWPERRFCPLDPSAWEKFGNAIPIAMLDEATVRVGIKLWGRFEPAGISHPGQNVLMLRLRSGQTVALLGSDERGAKITLLADPADDPEEVIEHFVDLTGFRADKVTRIESS